MNARIHKAEDSNGSIDTCFLLSFHYTVPLCSEGDVSMLLRWQILRPPPDNQCRLPRAVRRVKLCFAVDTLLL